MTKREFLDKVFALVPNEANAIMDAFDEYVESSEPHWIPVTEPPTDRMICYVTLKDTNDDLGKKEECEKYKWISCLDKLPDKERKTYWVCTDTGYQCECRWTNDVYGIGANAWSKWGWKKVDLPQFSKVVAYMPLPEPYKGVTE